ncbi:MAG: AAA family ATPase [Lachnospiraceae bacterium]|nr:AAA family ATPase [Lachnospiraceae bacterium]
MRLLSCHIENFGRLSDVSLEFRQGCHVICEKNGWGKSTLAAFIRVMLFGFGEEKARDELKNERRRYRPWQGGVYGGQLEFEAEGRAYIISRTFGTKEKEDSFSLREKETNLESGRFSSAVGEELFMLDEGSFRRTIFISQNDCETYTTDGINAKMGNLAEDTEDINHYEKVDGRLADLLNKMSPRRATGSLYKMKNDIAALEERVRSGHMLDESMDRVHTALQEKSAEQEELKAEQARLMHRQQELGAYKDVQAKQEKYAELCREYEERRRLAKEAGAYFPDKLPEEEELRMHIAQCSKLSAVQETVNIHSLTEAQQQRWETLTGQFAGGYPTEEVLKEQDEKIRELKRLKLEAAEYRLSEEEEAKLQRCRDRFGNDVPGQQVIENAIMDWKDCADKKALLNQKQAMLEMLELSREEIKQTKRRQRNRSLLSALLIGVGVILAAAGIFCAISAEMWAVGGILAALGLLLCIVGLLRSRGKAPGAVPEETNGSRLEQLRREIEADEELVQTIEPATKGFLAAYGIECGENRILDCLYELKAERQEYMFLLKKVQDVKEKNSEEKIRKLEQEIQDFLTPYFPAKLLKEEYFSDDMGELRMQIGEYLRLQEKVNQYKEASEAYGGVTEELKTFIEGLSMTPKQDMQAQLLEIQSRLQTFISCKAEYEKAKEQKDAFEHQENVKELLKVKPVEAPETLENIGGRLSEIASRLEEVQGYIGDYKRQLDGLREEADRLTEEEQRLTDLKKEYMTNVQKYELLKKTKELLGQAKTSFTAKYTEPLRTSFEKYYELLTNESGRRYHMDANHALTVEEKGMQRDPKFFSAGYRDLIGICMRMALVDAMYQEEKPFIIFDDPFANLDKEKVKGALALLHSICKEYQVLYFTCHESRMQGD